ncbi:MAG: flavin reductase [Elusimicrobia bacterium]|nr:flavin reductase [Elusimicrobiota bacterium]
MSGLFGHDAGFDKLIKALEGNGAFLVVTGGGGAANIMTIGWAQLGVVWGKPVMTVLVRPSRYTHGLLEKAGYFTVCVPPEGGMRGELAFCGSKSGRDCDKIRECGFTLAEGSRGGVKYIAGSELVYECGMLERTRVLPETLAQSVKAKYYAAGNYHTSYFGEIISVHKG